MVLAAAIVVVTYALARRLLQNERLAMLCALAVAIEPTMLAWSLKVMPETLLTLCLLLFVACAIQALEPRDVRWDVRWTGAAAIALCAAAYVKPVAYPLVFVIFAASLVARAPRMSIAFLLTSALLLAPWHLRNYERTGYAGFTSLMDHMLYLSAGGSIVAQREHRPFEAVRRELLTREKLRTEGENGERNARIRREGAHLLASDPLGYAITHAKGMARTLFDPGATEYLRFLGVYSQGARATLDSRGGPAAVARAFPLVFWLSIAFAIALLPLVVLPLFALRRPSREFIVLAIVAAYLITAGGGVFGTARFRVPAVPLLVLMSAFGVQQTRSTVSRGAAETRSTA
jgi:4-amino-4-deoxy-L-arabinose transferase-like glycosyltransferase